MAHLIMVSADLLKSRQMTPRDTRTAVPFGISFASTRQTLLSLFSENVVDGYRRQNEDLANPPTHGSGERERDRASAGIQEERRVCQCPFDYLYLVNAN